LRGHAFVPHAHRVRPLERDHAQVVAIRAVASLCFVQQRARVLLHAAGAKRGAEFTVGVRAPHTVGAEHQGVVVMQRKARRKIDVGFERTAQTRKHFVAIGMTTRFFRRNNPVVDQILHFRMVACAVNHLTVANHVEPRIASVRPKRGVVLNDAGDASRARGIDHAKALCVIGKRFVRCVDRALQKKNRRRENRLRFIFEALDDEAHDDVRRDFATHVTAHAVGHHQTQGIAGVNITQAILIHLAGTAPRFLKN
jgi:hypothetical protein